MPINLEVEYIDTVLFGFLLPLTWYSIGIYAVPCHRVGAAASRQRLDFGCVKDVLRYREVGHLNERPWIKGGIDVS